jgi:hypothetical protein
MGLPDDLIDDALIAVSELVTNVHLHVLGGGHPPGDLPAWGGPELWLYRRGQRDTSQIMCKVFDHQREHPPLAPTQPTPAEDALEHGRGLSIVEELSAAWGWHLTRSRLGDGRSIPGKATWFAMPIPPYAAEPPIQMTAAQAAYTLQNHLAARGILQAIRCDNRDLSVLSICRDLTVWCRQRTFSWTAGGDRVHYPFTDIVEVAEQLVRLYEEMAIADVTASEQHRPPGDAHYPGQASA